MAQRASRLLLVAVVLSAGGVFARCDTALAVSPSGILTGYGTTTWGQKDGLPSAVIWALAQDRAGYLWLGTNTGLVRFDGVRFTEWSALSDVPLRELPIRALLAAGDALWVGYAEPGGVSRIADGRVQHYGSAEGLPAGLVATLVEDSAGQIWAGTREGLSAFDNNRWSRPAGGLPARPGSQCAPGCRRHAAGRNGRGPFQPRSGRSGVSPDGRHRKPRPACHRRSFEPHVDHRSHQRLPRGR